MTFLKMVRNQSKEKHTCSYVNPIISTDVPFGNLQGEYLSSMNKKRSKTKEEKNFLDRLIECVLACVSRQKLAKLGSISIREKM